MKEKCCPEVLVSCGLSHGANTSVFFNSLLPFSGMITLIISLMIFCTQGSMRNEILIFIREQHQRAMHVLVDEGCQ